MEDEPEVLDWGNEDDETQMFSEAYRNQKDGVDLRRGDVEDAEEAVSLGGDDEDDIQGYVYQSRSLDGAVKVALTSAKSANLPTSTPTHQSTREHQRAPSTNSQKRSQSQSRGSQESPQHPLPLSKITHALPPKPVVASVPYLHPSHPSIIEATAMSSGRSDREKKSNGIASKSVSSTEGTNSLPPDWELRYSRSGRRSPYYYNTRTREGTWSPPTSTPKSFPAKDKELSRTQPPDSRSAGKGKIDNVAEPPISSRSSRPEAESQAPPALLSYEDRHYRPDNSDSYKPRQEEDRFQTRDVPRARSSPSPEGNRPRPSLKQVREQDHQLPRRASSPHASGGHVPRDLQRDGGSRATHHDHWVPSHHAPLENSSRVRSVSPPVRRRASMDLAPLAVPAFEESRNDTVWSSSPRHRSPPPHLRVSLSSSTLQVSQEIAPRAITPTAVPRQKARFDRPANPPQQSLRGRGHDIYIPAGSPRQREQLSELTFQQVNPDNGANRMRPDDLAPDVYANRANSHPNINRSASSLPERSTSASPTSDEMQMELSRIRKRQPLPPQSARFRESERSRVYINQSLSSSTSTAIFLGSKDGSRIAVQHSTNVHSSVPSGPRFQSQHTIHSELPRASRLPPSGPSATSAPRSRSRHEPLDSPNESPALRDRDIMDVDNVPPSRASFRPNEPSIRAGSGMYADREHNSDLPKGPRAMANKPSGPSSCPPPGMSPSISPTMVFADPISSSGPEQPVNRMRDRSPPPHLAGHDRWEQYSEPPDRHPGNSNVREEVPIWRSDGRGDDLSTRQKMAREVERGQPRREVPAIQTRLAAEFSRPPSSNPRTLSGTNSIPVGNRKSGVVSSQQESSPRDYSGSLHGQTSGRITEPPSSRVSRVYPRSVESFESPHQFSNRVLSPVDSYRPASTEGVISDRKSVGGNPPVPFERLPLSHTPTNATVGRSRRDSYYDEVEAHRFERSSHEDQVKSAASRTWTPRQQTSPTLASGDNYRSATPPLSRESSLVSPGWDASFGSLDRSSGRLHQGARQPIRSGDTGLRREEMELDLPYRRQQAPPSGRERVAPEPERNSGALGLESRLSERYDDRYAELHRRPHALPPNPSLSRDDNSYINDAPRQARLSDHRAHSSVSERDWSEPLRPREDSIATDRNRVFDDINSSLPPQDNRSSKPRVRRFGPAVQEIIHPEPVVENTRAIERHRDNLDSERQERAIRRGGSLLDRLSLDNDTGSNHGPSLRERVQLPVKRDREEMMSGGGDSGSMDAPFDLEDGLGGDTAKKSRRRSGKPRRGRTRHTGS